MNRLFQIFFALFLLTLPGLSFAGVMIVKAEGQSVKYDEAADVKKLAIEDALQKAARDVFSAVIKEERVAIKPSDFQELYSSLTGYVLTYKILSEGWLAPEIPAQPAAPGQPVVPVQPVVPAPEPATPEGLKPGETPMPLVIETYQVRLEATIDADQMKAALSRAIASKGGSGLKSYAIVMLDAPGYEAYRLVMEILSRIPTVKDVSYDSFSGSRYAFIVRSTESEAELVQRLSGEIGADYAVFAANAETIAIKYFADKKD